MKTVVAASDRVALVGLYRSGWNAPPAVFAQVQSILMDVQTRGDAALVDLTREYDAPAYDLSNLRVPLPVAAEARTLVPPDVADALSLAKERVARFHGKQRRDDISFTEDDGTLYGFAYRPLDSVAAYVPGAAAALPSSVVMSAVPARIAGVGRVVVMTPPRRDGTVHPAVLFACSLCEVDELYAVGGAQAIAAAAYGTQSLAPVDKIVGPGNVWVTEAKRQVFGICGIDGLAGPSEVLVVADDGASSELVVGELLAQAERDDDARIAVVSESRSLLDAVAQLLDTLDVKTLPRGEIIDAVVDNHCFLIHASSRREVFDVVARFAPEHLSLQVRDPEGYLPYVRRAGVVFVGDMTPAVSGSYMAGTNHVLPTSGAARFSSGLSLADFTRTFSIVRNSRERMLADAQPLAALADFEGLPLHAQTARMRSEL